jgi:hypothetical protein
VSSCHLPRPAGKPWKWWVLVGFSVFSWVFNGFSGFMDHFPARDLQKFPAAPVPEQKVDWTI